MKHLTRVLLLFVLVSGIAQASQQPRFENGLRSVLSRVDNSTLVPVLVAFDNPLSPKRIQEEVRGKNLVERRAYVITRLKDHFRETSSKSMEFLHQEVNAGYASQLYPLWIANAAVVHLRADRIKALLELGEVERIRYDYPYPIERVFDDRRDVTGEGVDEEVGLDAVSWGVERIGAPELWAQGFTGEGKLITIIDSGTYIEHADLNDHIWINPGEIPGNGEDDDQNGFIDDVHGWSFMFDNNDISDVQGHGTKTAGIAVGDGTNGDTTGVAPDATLMVLQNYDPTGQISSEATHFVAVQYAVENGADVITCSMSYDRVDSIPIIPDYVTARYTNGMSLAAGVIQANSTGNDGDDIGVPWNISNPANCPPPFLHPDQTLIGGITSILGCGMYTVSGTIHSDSDRGVAAWEEEYYPIEFQDYPWDHGDQFGLLKPDLVGPSGVRTLSRSGGYWSSFAGTSASTPSLGGALVLLRSIHQQATPEVIAEAVMMTAIDTGPAGFDTAYGAGEYRVDLAHEYLDEMFDYGSLHLSITTEDSGEPENLLLLIGDGEIRRPLHALNSTVDRILPGTYNIRLEAEGYDVVEAMDVVIEQDVATELELELPLFNEGILPVSVNEEIEWDETLTVNFSIANNHQLARQFEMTFEPASGLDWQEESAIDLSDVITGSARQAVAWFDTSYVLAGLDDTTPTFWRYDSENTLIETVLMPPPFNTYGIQSMCGVDDTLFVTKGTQWLYLLDETFVVCDSIDFSAGTTALRGVAYDTDNGNFYVSNRGGSTISQMTRDGGLVSQVELDDAIMGIAYHPEFFRGPALLLVDNSNGGKGRVKSLVLETADVITEAELSADGEFEVVYSLAMRNMEKRGIWQAQILTNGTGIGIFEREVWEGLYILPSSITVQPGGGSFDFSFYPESLPDDAEYQYRIHFRNLTDGWDTNVPVAITVRPVSALEGQDDLLPSQFALHEPWPNPFNPTVQLAFDLPRSGRASLRIVNLLGQTVTVLQEGQMQAGRHTVTWNGASAASGMYLAVLEMGAERSFRKMMLLK